MWKPNIPSDTLMHSRGAWKTHKYIAIKNGKYIYPGDSVKSNTDTINIKKLHDANMRKAQAKKAQERGEQQTKRDTINTVTVKSTDASTGKTRVHSVTEKGLGISKKKKKTNAASKIYEKAKAAVKDLPSKVIDYLPATVTVKSTDVSTGKTRVHSVTEKGWGSSKKKKKKTYNSKNLAGVNRSAVNSNSEAMKKESAYMKKYAALNAGQKAADAAQERGKQQTKRENINKASKREALNKRNLEAARNKAARKKARAGAYRGAANTDSNRVLNNSRELSRLRKSKYTGDREFAKEQAYTLLGDYKNERKARKKRIIADKVYVKGVMNTAASVNKGRSNGSWKMDDPRTRNKAKGKRPARLDVAAKQAGNAISREAYRTGYKARKAVSSAAREAWNTASSYREKFKDYKTFYKWYMKKKKK